MPIRLIIAEKPNVAQAIAETFSSSAKRNEKGIYEIGGDRIVACAGHILENFDPQDYDPKYKKWVIDDLPIDPSEWKLKPIPSSKKRLEQIRSAMQGVDIVINCGDNDAEGNLLVDEVIDYLGWKGKTQRVIIADLNPKPIQKAFDNIKDNADFAHLTRKALARSRADWLLGMNCSRLYSKLADQVGINAVLSAGRVQSAVLGLVARRDLEIQNFKPRPYFTAKLQVTHEGGDFVATWKPSEEQEGLDEKGRLIDETVLDRLRRLTPGDAVIISAETARKTEKVPLPYSLSELQKEANRRYGMTLSRTLEVAQELYDKYKLTTYPRVDTGHMPNDWHGAAPAILESVKQNIPALEGVISGADYSIKSWAFDDKKVEAHHGIAPTEKADPGLVNQLSTEAKQIYELVCQRFIAQFYPSAEFDATTIDVGVPHQGAERFEAKGKIWRKQGWRLVLKPSKNTDEDEGEDEDDGEGQELPAVKTGDSAKARQIIAESKKTQPPKPYTDATLVTAMTGIHRYVTNPEIRKLLRDNDGIGTEATRANIVTTLVERGHLKRVKKFIHVTKIGLAHFHLLPPELTTPDLAGIFEKSTRDISEGKIPMESLLNMVRKFINSQLASQEVWLERAKKYAPVERPSEFKCRNCESPLFEKNIVKDKKRITYYVCRTEDCACHFQSDNGVPGSCFKGPLKESDAAEAAQRRHALLANAPACSECGNPLMRRKKTTKDWFFWTCEEYEGKARCETVYLDDGGAPGAIFIRRGVKVERQADGPECQVCAENTFKGKTKKTQTPLYNCNACDSMCWVNKDGSPGQLFKIRGEMQKQTPTGPACPECKEPTVRAKTKKKKPILVCESCDSMCWVNQDGKPAKLFKKRGKMV